MKLKKILCTVCIMTAVVFNLVGCGENNISTESANESGKQQGDRDVAEESIKIDDIAWNVDEGVVDGDRYVLLEYTNNSTYSIISFELNFKEKLGITQEEKDKFYTDVQENFSLSDDDLKALKEKAISIHATTNRIVNPSESIKDVNCYYFGGSYYLKNLEHYNLVEPDIATVKYIDGKEIYTTYYDFASKKYSTEDKTEIAYQWSATELGNKIPKPDVKVVEAGRDDDIIFMFDAYGLTLEQFNAYVEECKALGYTVDEGSFEGFYSADNAEGYNVYLSYDEDDYSMSGTVESPNK